MIEGIFKRSISSVMGKLILFEKSQPDDSDYNIRHYDVQCEAAIQIKNAIQSGINRKKAEFFFQLRFLKFDKSSNVSRVFSKSQVIESKTTSGSKKQIVYPHQRRNTFNAKQNNQENCSQISMLLSKIKKFREKPHQKYSCSNFCERSSIASSVNSRVYDKMIQLQNQFTELLKCEKETRNLIRSRVSIRSKYPQTPNRANKTFWEMPTASKTWKKKTNIQENCDSEWTLG